MASNITNYASWLNSNPDAVQVLQGGFAPPAAPAPAQPSPYAKLEEIVRPQAPAAAPPAAQVAAPQAEAPTFEPVVAPQTRAPRAALRQVQAQQLESLNEIGASQMREGEAKAKAAEERAGATAEGAQRTRRYAAAAEREVDDNKILQGEAKKWVEEDMRKLREPPLEKTGWQKAVSALTGIVGMVAQGWLGPGVGGGIAYGLNALDDHVSRNIRDQLEEQERAGNNITHTTKYLDTLEKDSVNDLDVASKLAANHWLATEQELQALAEQAKSPQEREAALRLAEDARLKGLGLLERNYTQQIADERAAAAARANAAVRAADADRQRVKDALDAQKTMAEIDKLRAEADKARSEGQVVAPDGREVVNPQLFSSYKPEAVQKFAATEVNNRELLANIAELDALLQKHGTEGNWGSDEAKAAATRMEGLSKLIQLNIKKSQELGTLDKGSVEFLEGMVGDPNALFTSGTNMRERIAVIRDTTLRGTEAQAASLGLGSRRARATADGSAPTAAPPAEHPARPAAPATVRMVGPDGRTFNVPAERVDAARRSGLRLPDEITQAEANAPQAADVAEEARVQQALASVGG